MSKRFAVLGLVFVSACTSAAGVPETKARTKDPVSQTAGESDESDETASRGDAPGSGGTAMRPGIEAFPGSKVFMPPKTPAPGIVMLHGSEGGSEKYIQDFATEIAKRGFVVMTLCWFGCTGKPPTITRIPLESVVQAGQWLKGSHDVKNGEVGLFGWSRGAELSLLVTSLVAGADPFQAVAVHAPSDTVVSAFDPATQNTPPNYGGIMEPDPKTGTQIPAPSWTWKGQPLYGEPTADFQTPGPAIAVTKYPAPVYVSQGENDEIWEVARGRRVVAARKAVAGLVTESHFFPGEGHVLQQPATVAVWNGEVASFFQRRLSP